MKYKSASKRIVAEHSNKNFQMWKDNLPNPNFIALLSPFYYQYDFFKETFPNSKIFVFDIKTWNLNNSKGYAFDLISASSVFMYSPDPEKWFKNVFKCCKYFWIHDLIDRRRSSSNILGLDNDKMRFSFSPDCISSFKKSYDLSVYDDKVLDFVDFKVNDSVHFLANFRGDLESVTNPNLTFHAILRDVFFKIKSRYYRNWNHLNTSRK